MSFKPKDKLSQSETIHRVEQCLKDITSWMNANMLKLNAEKTEVIVFSSKHNSQHVSDVSIIVGDTNIKPSDCVRNLGAWFDSRMSMDAHINSISKSCYTQLRQIGHIRQYITNDATKSLFNSLVTSRLDYCNGLLYGVPQNKLDKLQKVQNCAARVISRTSRYEHITPVLKDLHWLPIQHRVKYKIMTHTFKALNGQSPIYIRNLLSIYKPRRSLRSQNKSTILEIPSNIKGSYGDSSFAVAAPTLWNSLPCGIRDAKSLCSFKRSLKTHYFIEVYGK